MAKFNLRNPVHFIALGFGSGLAPKAPGTFGTLAAVPLVVAMMLWLTPAAYLVTTLIASLLGIYLCGKCADDVGVHDHPAIVWDEVAGLMVTFFLMPLTVKSVIIGFLLFRLFDIVKPWPIRLLDKHVHGGVGIMVDDIVAGVFAWLVMFGLLQAGWL